MAESRELITVKQYADGQMVTRDAIYKQISKGTLPKEIKVKRIHGHVFLSIPTKLLIEHV